PITKANSQPSSLTSLISCANALTVLPSIPKLSGPANTSPVTLRMMRLYFGTPLSMTFSVQDLFCRNRFAKMVTRESPDLNFLAEPRTGLIDNVCNRLVRILYERLFQQTGFGVKALYFSVDDFVDKFLS